MPEAIASWKGRVEARNVHQKSSTHQAVFGYRLGVGAYRYSMPRILLAALLPFGGLAQAADALQPKDTTEAPASDLNGTESPGGVNPIGGNSLCPTADATWQELLTLVPREHLDARLAGASEGPIQIEDLGGKFRISVLHREREYREEARDCAHRARMASIFAALIIDPAALLEVAPCEHPPCFAGVPASPIPAPAPKPPAPPPPPIFRLDLGPLFMMGVDAEKTSQHWGGSLRMTLGRGSLVPVLGAVVVAPVETNVGGVRLREWRLPVDLGMRVVMPGSWADLYGEVGIALALLSERALDLAVSNSRTALEFSGRVGLGIRLKPERGLTTFVALQAELVPDPPSVFALPWGEAGRTPRYWMGASMGASWGI
jgi:hypothetical protein